MISVQDLKELIASDSNIRILDCSTQTETPALDFSKGHIKGAVLFDLKLARDL